MRKERHRISSEDANSIIDKALTLIKDDKIQDELFVLECDSVPDILTIVDADGKYHSKKYYSSTVQAVQDFYAEVSMRLKVDLLLEFDYGFLPE